MGKFHFGRRKDKSPPPAENKKQQNPYASMANDPYTSTHYQPAHAPHSHNHLNDRASTASTLVGSNHSVTGSRKPGGYGGMGGVEEEDPDRAALFAGASRKAPHSHKAGTDPGANQHHDNSETGAYENHSSQAPTYTPYGEQRELNAEEAEEEDINATKQNIRAIKQDDVATTRRLLQIADEAEQSGRNTLERLGAQGERIHNTDRNLDLAANHQYVATEKARELKKLNGSMFAVHATNPFTKAARRRERDEDIVARHQAERDGREANRQAAFRTGQRVQDVHERTAKANAGANPAMMKKASLAERAQYQFQADSEDDEMEGEIEGNLDLLQGAAGRLHALALATGQEVDEQNKKIDVLIGKSDRLDDQIHMNQARLNRIK